MIQPAPGTITSRDTCVLSLNGGVTAAFRFGPGDLIEIGRSRDCAIPLDDRFASRRHCRIGLIPGEGLVLRDLGSANGTMVNGTLVERVVLRTGDLIEIGAVELRVKIDAGAARGDCVQCGEPVTTTSVAAAPISCPDCTLTQGAQAPPVDVIRALAKEGYQVIEELGRCGSVLRYRGRRISFAQEVFLEVLPLSPAVTPREVTRFVEGAQAQAALRHRNVAAVYDVRQRRDLLMVVLEQIPGETLRSTLERGGKRLAVKEALRIAYQVASALAHLDEHKVVHRDIRPDNIIITPEGDAKLINFGLAKIVTGDQGLAGTAFGDSLGTPGYMAPEQIHTARYADIRADIYGLGATLYHSLSGRSAARAQGDADEASLSPLAEVPRSVVALVMRMVQPKPQDRFRTPIFVLRALEVVTSQLTGVTADATNIDLLLRLEHDESDLFLTPVRAQPRQAAVFSGRIQDMALVEFLQMLEFNGKSGTLTVSEGGFNAEVIVREGLVIDAEAGAARGRSVLRRALDLEGGEFSFEPHLVPAPVRKDKTVRIGQLLLDHLRAVDEAER